MKKIALFISSGCYSGYFPVAPGTFGSAIGLLVWWLIPGNSSFLISTTLVVLTTLLGFWAVNQIVNDGSEDDPGWIVIDEWIGLFCSLMIIVPSNHIDLLLAFIFFRIFDASKIWPVGWAEKFKGSLGIILDDIVAGILAGIVVCGIRFVM